MTLCRYDELAKQLIRDGADVNEPFGKFLCTDHHDYDPGTTFLQVAVHRHNVSLARILIANHADVSARNWRNETALYFAINAGCPADLVEEMLNLGARAELTEVNSEGRTHLHSALVSCNEDLVRLLLAQPEVDATLVNAFGQTTLHFAADSLGQSVKIAEWLLEKGVQLNAVDEIHGQSALHLALRTEKSEMVSFILLNSFYEKDNKFN